ncbi:MAG TPA: hypothetical protein VJU61_06475, partial [Polyangiaceae bacterium]|nr:hypothetical protein [Polyangiaceae bacterium]
RMVEYVAQHALGEEASVFARAREAGVLVERPGGQLAFSHGLVREVLYRDLPEVRRRQLHQAVAEVLERRSGVERPWAELAHHYLEAGPPFASIAVERSLRAAGRALDAAADEEALRLLERAKLAHELAPVDLSARAELRLAEGAARSSAGQGARGRELCREAAELARQLGQPELFARAALGYGVEFSFGATDASLVQLLEEALAGLPESDAILRARLLARLASARQPSIFPRQTVAAALAAIEMARRLQNPATLLACLHTGMSALMDFVRSDERLPLNLEAERLALELGDRPKALRARARLFFDYLELGELGEADQHLARYTELARELGSERQLWPLPLFQGLRACMHGHFASVEAALAAAAEAGERAADPARHWMLTFHRFGLARAREQHAELLALEPQLRAVLGSSPPGELWSAIVAAQVRARVGQPASAAALLESLNFERLLEASDLTSLGMLADVVASIENEALAARVYPLLLPLQGHLFCYGMMGMFCEAPYDRQLGRLAALLGRGAEADRHFGRAIDQCRRLDLRPHLARCLFEHAEARRGSAAEAAVAQLQEAQRLASKLELTDLRPSIEALLAELAPPPASVATGDAPAFELRHEGEYWSIVAPGELLRLKDMRGLHLLQRLVSHPEQEFHVLDLAALEAGQATALGDAGELLDVRARAAYRERVADLEERLRDAEAAGDSARAHQAQQELDFLGAEL